MICNPSKCKELVVRKKYNNTQYEQICNITQCNSLSLLGVTLQSNCKFSEHAQAIPLFMITMRKAIYGLPLLSCTCMGLRSRAFGSQELCYDQIPRKYNALSITLRVTSNALRKAI